LHTVFSNRGTYRRDSFPWARKEGGRLKGGLLVGGLSQGGHQDADTVALYVIATQSGYRRFRFGGQLARVQGERKIMMDTLLAYLISLGITGAGVGWIVVGTSSTLGIGIGIASLAVGAASLLNELRYRRHG
jgi:hypothetical protein